MATVPGLDLASIMLNAQRYQGERQRQRIFEAQHQQQQAAIVKTAEDERLAAIRTERLNAALSAGDYQTAGLIDPVRTGKYQQVLAEQGKLESETQDRQIKKASASALALNDALATIEAHPESARFMQESIGLRVKRGEILPDMAQRVFSSAQQGVPLSEIKAHLNSVAGIREKEVAPTAQLKNFMFTKDPRYSGFQKFLETDAKNKAIAINIGEKAAADPGFAGLPKKLQGKVLEDSTLAIATMAAIDALGPVQKSLVGFKAAGVQGVMGFASAAGANLSPEQGMALKARQLLISKFGEIKLNFQKGALKGTLSDKDQALIDKIASDPDSASIEEITAALAAMRNSAKRKAVQSSVFFKRGVPLSADDIEAQVREIVAGVGGLPSPENMTDAELDAELAK